MARQGPGHGPVVLTARGRRVAAFAVGVSVTTAALALTLPSLGGTPPFSPIGDPNTMQTTTPADDGSGPDDRPVTGLPTDEPDAPATSPPAVVNGREQPPRVEPPAAASGNLVVVPGLRRPVPARRS